MRQKPKKPPVPAERRETLRQSIISALEGRSLSAKDISSEVGIPEGDVYAHLEHIEKSLGKRASRLAVTPAVCKKCGFEFRKRERLTKPGRCPVCKAEAIEEPLFSIKEW
jgi:hypothetical protein